MLEAIQQSTVYLFVHCHSTENLLYNNVCLKQSANTRIIWKEPAILQSSLQLYRVNITSIRVFRFSYCYIDLYGGIFVLLYKLTFPLYRLTDAYDSYCKVVSPAGLIACKLSLDYMDIHITQTWGGGGLEINHHGRRKS